MPCKKYIAWLGPVATRSLAMSIWYEFAFSGWDRSALRKCLQSTTDQLRADTQAWSPFIALDPPTLRSNGGCRAGFGRAPAGCGNRSLGGHNQRTVVAD